MRVSTRFSATSEGLSDNSPGSPTDWSISITRLLGSATMRFGNGANGGIAKHSLTTIDDENEWLNAWTRNGEWKHTL